MRIGAEKKIRLESKDAYGDKNPALIQEVPKERLPAHDFKAGEMLVMQSPDGQQFPVLIEEVKEKTVVLDLNHPMAGKTLNFTLKIVSAK